MQHGLSMAIAVWFLGLAHDIMPHDYRVIFVKHFNNFKQELEEKYGK
tara:strand:- start:2855 stop:2995 length:141 start_codon:yes stop_codon:yes gene_type:complete